jgi:lipopolysaccharide transport system permease protein
MPTAPLLPQRGNASRESDRSLLNRLPPPVEFRGVRNSAKEHVSNVIFPTRSIKPQVTITKPTSGWQPTDLGELWRYRELLWILAMRDVRVRYKQTLLGVAWAIIQPFFSMVLFVILFSRIAKLSTDGMPPAVFYFCGMLPWQLFANALTQAGNSLISNQNLITKVYFPRLVIPIAAVITGLIDFALSLVVLAIIMAWYHVAPGPRFALFPFFVLLALAASLGVGLLLSALNVEYRDVRYVIPFLTNFWFWATPVVLPSSMFQKPWERAIVGINPMSGVVVGFRWCMGGNTPPGIMLGVSCITITLVLLGGTFYFRRMEKTFADLV